MEIKKQAQKVKELNVSVTTRRVRNETFDIVGAYFQRVKSPRVQNIDGYAPWRAIHVAQSGMAFGI